MTMEQIALFAPDVNTAAPDHAQALQAWLRAIVKSGLDQKSKFVAFIVGASFARGRTEIATHPERLERATGLSIFDIDRAILEAEAAGFIQAKRLLGKDRRPRLVSLKLCEVRS